MDFLNLNEVTINDMLKHKSSDSKMKLHESLQLTV